MKNYTITVNGVAYNVTVEENGSAPAASAASAPAAQPAPAPSAPKAPAQQGSITVEAPMPGNILDVKVKTGDSVTKGATLVILEAMKMENEIVSPCDGTIASVNVSKGESVDAGKILITLV